MRTHVVQKGDTLWKIAKQYGVNFEELKSLNSHLANPDYVMPGMEIFLPDNVSTGSNKGKTATTRTTSYKEKLTEPIIPISEAQPAPAQEPAPVVEEAPVQEAPPSKEKLTQPRPLPEYIMPQPIQPVPPAPPMPQPEVMPDFHLDFAPQLHFTQPVSQTLPTPQPQPVPMQMIMPQQQPQHIPMPMPIPQPIMIQMPKPEVEEKEVTRTEYVPVPQPYYVYIPYIPEQMMPVHHPCPCSSHHHVKPCGCGGNQQMPMHMQYTPMHMEQMPMMEMPCGCGGSQHFDSNFMQPQYFEPNYDIAPVMVDNNKDSTLPDWLEDSSSSSEDMNLGHELGFDAKYNYDDYSQMQEGAVPDFYHGSPNEHVMGYPMQQMPYMPHNVMPDHMMPHHMMQQQMTYPMYQNQPFMNQNLPHYTPWNY